MRLGWAVVGAALLVGACDDSPDIIDPPIDPGGSIPLPILGRGVVTERITSEVAAFGDWVYTGTWGCAAACGNAVKIWDASAAAPVLVDSLIILDAGTTGDVQISEDGLVLVVANEYNPNGAITLFDRTTPARPMLLSRFTSPEIARGVHTVKLGTINSRQYAFLSINPSGSAGARLVIVEITDPRNPVQVFAAFMGNPFVHDVFVRDGIMFTALWDDGLTIWDVGGGASGGSPDNPVQLGNVRTVNGDVHNVFWFHDPGNGAKRYAFVGQESPGTGGPLGATGNTAGDIHVVDVSDLSAPIEVAFFRVNQAGVHNFAVDEASGILYAAYYNAGVRALDVRGDLGTCTTEQRGSGGRCNLLLMGRALGHVPFPGAVSIWGVALSGNVLYASDMLSGVWKIDISLLRR